MEIPYLRGDIDFKKIVSNKSLIREGDQLLGKLAMNCPYIGHLGHRRISKNLIDLGYNANLNFGEGKKTFN